jgi:hypothetical protein
MMGEEAVSVSVTLSGEHLEFIDRMARETQRSRSGMVRQLIQDGMNASQAGTLPRKPAVAQPVTVESAGDVVVAGSGAVDCEFTPEQIRSLNEDVRKNEAARRRKARRLAGLAALDPDEPRYRPKPAAVPAPFVCDAEDHDGRDGCSNWRCERFVCDACRPVQAETRCTSCQSRTKAMRAMGLDCHCKQCFGKGLSDKMAYERSKRPVPAHERCNACQTGDHFNCAQFTTRRAIEYCRCRGECGQAINAGALTPSA